MATTIDYASDYENPSTTIFHRMNDYGKEASDYQTTMAENPSGTIDYDSLTRGKLCPLKERGALAQANMRALMDMANGRPPLIACKPPECDGPRCAW